jgi:hypothetical protein
MTPCFASASQDLTLKVYFSNGTLWGCYIAAARREKIAWDRITTKQSYCTGTVTEKQEEIVVELGTKGECGYIEAGP